MSNLELEDNMLTSALQFFFTLSQSLDHSPSNSDPVEKISNDIEQLKDIDQQASLHLECYKSHEKLLLKDQNNLINKQNMLIQEYSKYKQTPKPQKILITKDDYKKARLHKLNLEDQIVKFKVNLQNLREKEEKLQHVLTQSCFECKKKDNQIFQLSSQLERPNCNFLSPISSNFSSLSQGRSSSLSKELSLIAKDLKQSSIPLRSRSKNPDSAKLT